MTPTATVHHGDALDVLRSMPDSSVDSVVCDPPYGLSREPDMVEVLRHWLAGDDYEHKGAGFMGKSWDSFVPGPSIWRECFRVLKPGGHLVAFAGSRTYDLMGVAIRIAGFEIRDGLQWAYGSGFPKSLDVSKAVDRMAYSAPLFDTIRAHVREWRDRAGLSNAGLNAALGLETSGSGMAGHWTSERDNQRAIPSKQQWRALKAVLLWPDCELDEVYDTVKDGAERPVLGSRDVPVGHSFAGATYGGDSSSRSFNDTAPATSDAARWAGWGTALKPSVEPIVLARKPLQGTVAGNVLAWGTGGINVDSCRVAVEPGDRHGGGVGGSDKNWFGGTGYVPGSGFVTPDKGRWPSNFVLSHASTPDGYDACEDGCVDGCPVRELNAQSGTVRSAGLYNKGSRHVGLKAGAASIPIDGLTSASYDDQGGASRFFPTFRYQAKAGRAERPVVDGVAHPTVKPLSLCAWLIRLVTPPGGTVLDPFAGSGTTGEAALLGGFAPVLIEREAEYLPLIDARLERARAQLAARVPAEPDLFSCADE